MESYRIPYHGRTLYLNACQSTIHDQLTLLGITSYWLDGFKVRLRLPGGKGGFGSQLKAQGNKMSQRRKREGVDSCRDLQGRRLRTIKESQQITEYIQKLPELERRREEEITAKMERQVEMAERKPKFRDVKWQRQREDVVGEAEMAVLQALAADDKGKAPLRRKTLFDDL